MICPSCKNQLIILEFNKVEIDYCPECSGIWLDSGELELLSGKSHHEGIIENFHLTDSGIEKKENVLCVTEK
jgi:Zn-finger nucleic acid-binding protein